jgi:nicotinate-nucleotide adenylyltransferase
MSESGERVGVFGGAFNPPHLGHVVCAQEARIELELDRVLLVPVGRPPHREPISEADAEQRLAMTRLAAIGQPGIEVSTIELDRDGTSFTADTLALLVEQEPEAELVLIIGADQAVAFGDWHEPGRVAQLALVAVAGRAGAELEAAAAEVGRHTGERVPLTFEMPRIDISSSMIRARVGKGETVAHLVPAGVAELIKEAGLYR